MGEGDFHATSPRRAASINQSISDLRHRAPSLPAAPRAETYIYQQRPAASKWVSWLSEAGQKAELEKLDGYWLYTCATGCSTKRKGHICASRARAASIVFDLRGDRETYSTNARVDTKGM